MKKFTIACKWKISFQKCGDTINHSTIYHLLFWWINFTMEPIFKRFSFIFNRIFTMVSNYLYRLKYWQIFDTISMFWWIIKFIFLKFPFKEFSFQYEKSTKICVDIKIYGSTVYLLWIIQFKQKITWHFTVHIWRQSRITWSTQF